MSDLTTLLAPLAGGAVAGYICGYAIKKILKIAIKVGAIIIGVFFMGLLFMQSRGYVSQINWDAIGNDLYASANEAAGQVDTNSFMGYFEQFGIPMSSGFVVGFSAAVLRTK